jgi:SAM-dependent methyltransferase
VTLGLFAPRSGLARRHPPVKGLPFTPEYVRRQRELVTDALGDSDLVGCFRERRELPRGYGAGFDERVIEYPWLLAREPGGRVLDAGSTLDHPQVLDAVLPLLESLVLVNVAASEDAAEDSRLAYVQADLRELPFATDSFDTVVSLSTLEHVGMDNSIYGVEQARAADPAGEVLGAVAELRRVLRPGGRALLSVPYGRPEDHGWFRQFGRADLEQLLTALAPSASRVDVYRYGRRGWTFSSLDDAADARYRDHRADPGPVRDGAPAARAVACLEAEL